MNNPVIILGAGKPGEVALDIFKSNAVIVYCFLDENEDLHGTEIDEVSVLGDILDGGYLKMFGKKCNAFISLDDLSVKKSVAKKLKDSYKVMPVNAVHANANVSESSTIGHGNMIEQGASVGTKADIADNCVIGSNAVLGNHAKIGDLTHIGAGSNIGSSVEIGEEVFIGAGVTIVSGVKIGKNARIGAGSVVIADVKAKETVFGNPAKKV